jgi:hypothetical protein
MPISTPTMMPPTTPPTMYRTIPASSAGGWLMRATLPATAAPPQGAAAIRATRLPGRPGCPGAHPTRTGAPTRSAAPGAGG